jgi:carnitine O-acetyltransferase
MLLARSINPTAPTLFHVPTTKLSARRSSHAAHAVPKKLEWSLESTPELRVGIRFAETRLSDLICQNDCEAMEFRGYGKIFITSHGFSPDAFVQMAFQAAYFGLYGMWGLFSRKKYVPSIRASGRIECTYEPAMTKAFLHGRTEAIRTVQAESIHFVRVRLPFLMAPPLSRELEGR